MPRKLNTTYGALFSSQAEPNKGMEPTAKQRCFHARGLAVSALCARRLIPGVGHLLVEYDTAMNIEGVIWLRDIVDKLAFKHHVETYEVEEVLTGKPSLGLSKRASERAKMFTWLWAGQNPAGTWRCCSSTRLRKKL